MLMRALAESEASSASALSIRRLCDGCAPLLAASSMEPLMQLYRQIQGSGDVAQNAYEQLDLDEEDVQQLIEGVTLVASALPNGQRQACVQQMLDIVVQPMQGLLQQAAATGATAAAPAGSGSAPGTPTAGGRRGAAAPGEAQLALVLPLMERVTTIFRAVKDPADVAEALVRLWPWIEAALGAAFTTIGWQASVCPRPALPLLVHTQ
jgi:hypothetical protein